VSRIDRCLAVDKNLDGHQSIRPPAKPAMPVLRVQYVCVVADRGSFEQFFRDEYQKMVALGLALTGVPEDARDLAQASMEKALRDWNRISRLDKPGAWLRRVTINAAASWHRSTNRDVAVHRRLRDVQPAWVLDPEASDFWAAIRALPRQQRFVVTLFYLEDLSTAEIASTLGIAVGTVKATLSQARANLSKTIVDRKDG
jgi:RNA polymerase sigma-70 factor, ECF subfamily